MRVPSVVITRLEGEWVIEVKDEESRDIWCEAPEFKTHSECDMPEELWENWPMKGEADIAYSCKERNFWNCSARVLGSVIGPDEATTAVLGVVVYNPEVVYEH
jgi:hypothetical protein